MKVAIYMLATIVIAACFLQAEPVVNNTDNSGCNIFVEDISGNLTEQTVHTFLDLNPFSSNDDTEIALRYYVVHSGAAKQKILNVFLPRLQRYHKHSKLPFSAVADYWEETFNVPIQIFVFSDNDHESELFCTSPACERIMTTARMLGLGFMWNGTLGIAEADIKEILDVPAEYKLVTAIFLNKTKDHEVSRNLP